MAAEWRGAYNILKEDFPITRLERTAYKVSNQGLIHTGLTFAANCQNVVKNTS